MPTVRALRTFLELPHRGALRPARCAASDVRLSQLDPCPVGEYRVIYREVGGRWHWGERTLWSNEKLKAHLARPEVTIWELRVANERAGFAELAREESGAVEIAYFGLVPRFIGRGLGGQFLTSVVEKAWRMNATRIWLHTCSLDSPRALPNYLARGFVVTGAVEYDEVVPEGDPLLGKARGRRHKKTPPARQSERGSRS
jgi:GNAT superfamily N-acetyltransferase